MVQLNTTYDKTLKQKIFVLKGEEAYARTTDVLADIISDFDDCNSHIRYCRVGLEIDVLREVGDAFVNIYDDDTMLLSIPWGEDMESIINNSYYNDKGIYWQNDKLIIGSSDNVDTGLFLSYDTLHNIQVKYTGNKQCLSSKSDVISFMEEKPDNYASTLTATASSVSVETGDSVAFTLNLSIPTSDIQHTVQVYDNGSLIDTLSIDANENVSYSKSGLSNGLHSIRFLFIGDEEAFSSETTVDVSVGYKLLLVDVPSYVVSGSSDPVKVGVSLTDYLDNPVPFVQVGMVEYIPNWGYEQISQMQNTDNDGYVLIEPVYVGTHEICAYYMSSGGKHYYSERVSVPVYPPTALDVVPTQTVVANGVQTRVGIQCNPPFPDADINVPITITRPSGTTTESVTIPAGTTTGYTTIRGSGEGDITVSATLGGLSNSHVIEDALQCWSVSKGLEYNKVLSASYSNVVTVNNGYKWYGNSSSTLPSLSFSFPKTKLVLDFDVISANASNLLGITTYEDISFSISNNDHISISIETDAFGSKWSIYKVYLNHGDEPIKTGTGALGRIDFTMKNYRENIIFDNLIIKKVQ